MSTKAYVERLASKFIRTLDSKVGPDFTQKERVAEISREAVNILGEVLGYIQSGDLDDRLRADMARLIETPNQESRPCKHH